MLKETQLLPRWVAPPPRYSSTPPHYPHPSPSQPDLGLELETLLSLSFYLISQGSLSL